MSIEQIQKRIRHYWRTYGTMNNIVVFVALVIAASWAWGSVTTMQRNFDLQKEVDARRRELELTELEVQTLQYQQNYYRSEEYKELFARQHLGLATEGEKVLILPPNSLAVKRQTEQQERKESAVAAPGSAPSNVIQWLNFFSGKSANSLQS